MLRDLEFGLHSLCLKGKPERMDCLKSVFTEVRVGREAREGAGLHRPEPSVMQVLSGGMDSVPKGLLAVLKSSHRLQK